MPGRWRGSMPGRWRSRRSASKAFRFLPPTLQLPLKFVEAVRKAVTKPHNKKDQDDQADKKNIFHTDPRFTDKDNCQIRYPKALFCAEGAPVRAMRCI